ncbi:MAG TPA: glycosyltransferase family 2 protein [Aggregatilineales bacterium]|nr:glycosyltransferase family 2 protein [Aggregatilineales bacterium]
MDEKPFVSVIMPIRNEADFIVRSLGAVLAQDYPPHRMEILVADGMSMDATRDIVAQTALRRKEIPVIVVDNPGRIVPTGINAALRQAKGDIIVRVDGHTIIDPAYVSECVSALARSGADNVGGRMIPQGTTPFGQAVALATSSPFGVGGGRFHYSDKEEWVDTVYMGAWPRFVFERIGNFDEELVRNQDDEFNYRLLAHGGKILLSDRILSKYYNRSSLRTLWRQYFQYGYWKIRVMQKHPGQMRFRQFVPPLFVGGIVVGLVLQPFSGLVRLLWLLGVALYIVANLAASAYIAARSGWPHMRWLPVIFATLHLSYGSGFLLGLINFANRWQARK